MKVARAKIKTNPIYTKYASDYWGRYLFYFGGAGSGKSVSAVQKHVKRLVSEDGANHRFMILRKVGNTLYRSVWAEFVAVLEQTGFDRFCKFKFSQGINYIKFLPNGNEAHFLGMDNPEKVKSFREPTSVFMEEATEFEEKDFLQLDLRLRGKTKYPKQLTACFNPVSEDHWLLKYVEPQLDKDSIKKVQNLTYLEPNKVWEFTREFYNKTTGKTERLETRTINTTSIDNRFLDDQYRAVLDSMASIDEMHYTVYSLGRWGRIIEGTPYCSQFDRGTHTRHRIEQDKDLPIHYTVDFNVSPYMSGLVCQLEYNDDDEWNGHKGFYTLRVLKEYTPKGKQAVAYSLGSFLTADMGINLDVGVFLYGDASGMKRSGIKDTKSHFKDLERGMNESSVFPVYRVPTSNPRYKRIAPNSLGRRAFLNMLFSGKLPVRILIDDECKELIADLNYCTTDTNGAKEKKKTKGVELRGHMLDAFEYFICHPKTLGHLAILE